MSLLQPDRTRPPTVQAVESVRLPNPEKFYLDNGLPVYAFDTGHQPLVRVDFIFEAGDWYAAQPFLAGATVKLLEDGTKAHSGKQLAEALDRHGAYLQCRSSKDITIVRLFCLSHMLAQVLPYICDMLQQPTFPERAVKHIKEEQRQRLAVLYEETAFLADHYLEQALFGSMHPYGVFPEGKAIGQLTRAAVYHHYCEHYTVDCCTIVASGKLPRPWRKLLNKHFGNWSHKTTGRKKKPVYKTQPVSRQRQYICQAGRVQTSIRLGWPFFSQAHPDYPGMCVLLTVLGGYFGARLMRNIREDKGYTYGIYALPRAFRHEGSIQIATEVGSKVAKPALDEIYREVKRLKEESVLPDELDLVRNYIKGSLMTSMDSPFALANSYIKVWLHDMDFGYYQKLLDTVEEISSKQLSELAIRYMDTSNVREIVVGGMD